MDFKGDDFDLSLQIPGRICLFGDKIDLIGLPVIAATINTLLTIKIKKRDDSTIKLYSENYQMGLEYQLGERGDLNHPLKYWCAEIYRLKNRIGGFEATIYSEIPIGSGLSSSAAISVALGKALNQVYRLGMDSKEIAELAYCAEHDDLGIMCGRMDQYSIAFGGATFIETGDIPQIHSLSLKSLPLVVGDSKEERQAKSVLNSIKERLNNNDEIINNAFKIIHNCVLEGRKALEISDYNRIGELMNIQQKQENIIGAATPKLNKLCAVSLDAGAIGAKQMGAGGGGCMIAICPGKQEQVAKAINDAGGEAQIYNIFNY